MDKKILYVFAHPDDETFGCGGTIAHFRSQGARQVLYCATRGEAGKTGNPPVCKPEELADVRTLELQRAVEILGIDELILRDYGDGKLYEFPFEQLVQDIVDVLEKERPDRVITFPPSGISGHRDHKIIQQATLAAMRKIQFSTKLYYRVLPKSTINPLEPTVEGDGNITDSFEISTYRPLIAEALRQHRSQHLSVDRVFPGLNEGRHDMLRTHEHYHLVDIHA